MHADVGEKWNKEKLHLLIGWASHGLCFSQNNWKIHPW